MDKCTETLADSEVENSALGTSENGEGVSPAPRRLSAELSPDAARCDGATLLGRRANRLFFYGSVAATPSGWGLGLGAGSAPLPRLHRRSSSSAFRKDPRSLLPLQTSEKC